MTEHEKLTGGGEALAGKLLGETREELVRADGKAQILFAATGVVISVVIGGILSAHWRPHDLSGLGQVLWWMGAGAAGIGVGALVFALRPRIGRAAAGRVRYFADIRKYETPTELVRALNEEANRKERDAEQLIALTPIVWTKYVATIVAIIALSAAVILTVAAGIVG